MKTLTYFLITDCFPLRLVGFDALLSNPEATNDCCSLDLKFGHSKCPTIWLRNNFPISRSSLVSHSYLQSSHIVVRLMHSMEKAHNSTWQRCSSVYLWARHVKLPVGFFLFVSESISAAVGGRTTRHYIHIYDISVCVRERESWRDGNVDKERAEMWGLMCKRCRERVSCITSVQTKSQWMFDDKKVPHLEIETPVQSCLCATATGISLISGVVSLLEMVIIKVNIPFHTWFTWENKVWIDITLCICNYATFPEALIDLLGRTDRSCGK